MVICRILDAVRMAMRTDIHTWTAQLQAMRTWVITTILVRCRNGGKKGMETFDGITGSRPASRAVSTASKRMTDMSEWWSKRDQSNTVSPMTER